MAERGASLASDAVINSYYNLAVSRGAAARSRAAAAQSVSAAIAAGLLALLVAHTPEQSVHLKVAAAVASSLWLVASAFYLRAIAARVQPDGDEVGADTAEEFVRLVLKLARTEELAIDRRQRLGNISVALALVASVAVIIGSAILAPTAEQVLFKPTSDQRELLIAACGSDVPNAISGKTRGELTSPDSFIIEIDSEQCDGQSISIPAGIYKPSSLLLTQSSGEDR